MPLLGSHLSVAGGFTKAIDAAVKLGCDTVQIFTKAPSQWRGREITDLEAFEFRKSFKQSKLKLPLVHDSYLINLAAPDEALYRRSIDAFVDEVQRSEKLGIAYIVTHPGAHVGAGEEIGLQRVVVALNEVVARTPDVKVKILIEATAGQGTTLGWSFGHLRAILKGATKPLRLGICLDTCHVFAAGYALWPANAYKKTMLEFDKVVGMKWLKAFHLNDSKKPLGSRVDRHEHLGQGCIGLEAFGLVVNDPRFAKLPMILETAKENGMDVVNLALLRELQQRG